MPSSTHSRDGFAQLSVQMPLPASGEGPWIPLYTYAATAGERAPVITQAVPYWEGDVVKGTFPCPSLPSLAAGQGEIASAWAAMPTSPRHPSYFLTASTDGFHHSTQLGQGGRKSRTRHEVPHKPWSLPLQHSAHLMLASPEQQGQHRKTCQKAFTALTQQYGTPSPSL